MVGWLLSFRLTFRVDPPVLADLRAISGNAGAIASPHALQLPPY